MVLLQQLQNASLETFGDLSECVLRRILKDTAVAYFVTDRYLPGSIKSFERSRRSESGSVRYKIERRDQKRTKQWSKYLKNPENKTDLINFLSKDWSDRSRFAELLKGKTLYVNVTDRFLKLTCPSLEVTIILFSFSLRRFDMFHRV